MKERFRTSAPGTWASIRDRDCEAYPVQQCAQRLDNAFRDLIDTMVVEQREKRLEHEAPEPRKPAA